MKKISKLEILHENGILVQPHNYAIIRKMTHEELLEFIARAGQRKIEEELFY